MYNFYRSQIDYSRRVQEKELLFEKMYGKEILDICKKLSVQSPLPYEEFLSRFSEKEAPELLKCYRLKDSLKEVVING